jgi:hypothetical protein
VNVAVGSGGVFVGVLVAVLAGGEVAVAVGGTAAPPSSQNPPTRLRVPLVMLPATGSAMVPPRMRVPLAVCEPPPPATVLRSRGEPLTAPRGGSTGKPNTATENALGGDGANIQLAFSAQLSPRPFGFERGQPRRGRRSARLPIQLRVRFCSSLSSIEWSR